MYGLLSRTIRFIRKSSVCISYPVWRTKSFDFDAIKPLNFEFASTRYGVQCYATRSSSVKSPPKNKKKKEGKLKPVVLKEDKDSFFVVRKGDLVGVYKNLSDCQAQVGSSVIIELP